MEWRIGCEGKIDRYGPVFDISRLLKIKYDGADGLPIYFSFADNSSSTTCKLLKY